MVKHPILRQGDNNTAFYLQLMNSLNFLYTGCERLKIGIVSNFNLK